MAWLSTLLRVTTLAYLAFLVVVTLAPVEMRPNIGSSVTIQHFSAFVVLGMLVSLSCRWRVLALVVVVIGIALTLELLQLAVPGRHARLIDFTVKSAGSLAGLAIVLIISRTVTSRSAE